MHAILFGIKRAFRTSVQVLFGLLEEFELTPARYDLLFIVREHGIRWMSDVRRRLGVTAATVSRMVDSLVERGIVTVRRPPEDRRQLEIVLTPKGDECMRRAMAKYRDSGGIDLFVESMFPPTGEGARERMLVFDNRLRDVRKACGDTSTEPDPWYTTDYDDEADENFEFWEAMEEIEELNPDDLGPAEIPIPASQDHAAHADGASPN